MDCHSEMAMRARKDNRVLKFHQGIDTQQRETPQFSRLLYIQVPRKALLTCSVLGLYHRSRCDLSENGSLYQIYLLKSGMKDASLCIFCRQYLVSHLFLPRLFLLMVLDKHRYLSYNCNGAYRAPRSDYTAYPTSMSRGEIGKQIRRGTPMTHSTESQGNNPYTKQCLKCKLYLPFNKFGSHRSRRDKLNERCKKCVNKNQRDAYVTEKVRGYDMRRRYGITLQQYNAMLSKQDGVCAICKNQESRLENRSKTGTTRRLYVDHDHKTGDVRALLCHECNTALGNMQEDPERIKSLLAYAEWCQTRELNKKIIQFPLFEDKEEEPTS